VAEGSPLQPVMRYLKAAVGPEGMGASDGELLQRFAMSRDEAAFELLLWRHGAMVQRVCQQVLQDQHAAEDACQAAFLTLARKATTLTRKDAVAGWLYRVAKRIALRLAQRRRPTQALVEVAAPVGSDADLLRAVHEEVARLPERYRVPVLLCFFEGLTHADAALRLNWPLGTVAGRLARAKDLLHARLIRRGVVLPATGLAGVLFVDAAHALASNFVRHTTTTTLAYLRSPTLPELPAHVLTLSNGAIQAMKQTQWAYAACAMLLLTGVLGSTLAWGQRRPETPTKEAPKPVVKDKPAAPGALPESTYAQRQRSKNNLKQIAIAIHSYHDANGHLPQDITDKDGKPLLSWRVAILPYLEQENLYRLFKLDEPWDSEHNKKLAQTRIITYLSGVEPEESNVTFYQFFSGPGTTMDPGRKLKLTDITDGSSNTLGVVEAGPAVPWAKPADILYHPKKALPKLVGPYAGLFNVMMMDGSTRAFKPDMDEDLLRLFIETADGGVIDQKKIDAAAAKVKLSSEEAKRLVADTKKKLKDINDAYAAAYEEAQKLNAELRQLTKKDETDLDELMEELERRKQQLELLSERNRRIRSELEALRKK